MINVWTNGCFDVLHRGHIELFKYAKSLGDKLIVGVDSDDKVKKDKGKDRPINNLEDRTEMLLSIKEKNYFKYIWNSSRDRSYNWKNRCFFSYFIACIK